MGNSILHLSHITYHVNISFTHATFSRAVALIGCQKLISMSRWPSSAYQCYKKYQLKMCTSRWRPVCCLDASMHYFSKVRPSFFSTYVNTCHVMLSDISVSRNPPAVNFMYWQLAVDLFKLFHDTLIKIFLIYLLLVPESSCLTGR